MSFYDTYPSSENISNAVIHAGDVEASRAGIYGSLILEAAGQVKDYTDGKSKTAAGVYASVKPEDIPAINSNHIGNLGTLIFQVSAEAIMTFDGYGTDLSTRLSEHNVIGSKPKVEVLGVGLIEKKLDVLLDTSLGILPSVEIEKINKMISSGKRQALIIGGKPKGYWLIEKASIEERRITNTGELTSAQVALSLKEAN